MVVSGSLSPPCGTGLTEKRRECMSFRTLACSLWIVSVVGAGAVVVAEEPSGAEWVGTGEATSAPQEGFALGDLSRLSQLEALGGNGGAEDDVATITAGYD